MKLGFVFNMVRTSAQGGSKTTLKGECGSSVGRPLMGRVPLVGTSRQGPARARSVPDPTVNGGSGGPTTNLAIRSRDGVSPRQLRFVNIDTG